MTEAWAPWCTCTNRDGYSQVPNTDDWVHTCGQPSRGWEEGLNITLVLFRGGPLDGNAYEVKTLLTPAAFALEGLVRYKWTPEKVISELTGATARVWVYEETQEDDVTARKTPEEKAADKAARAAAKAAAPASLKERRIAAKLARPAVATAAGVTVAQLARIEDPTSKRTTDEERQAVSDALSKLESASGEQKEGGSRGGRAGEIAIDPGQPTGVAVQNGGASRWVRTTSYGDLKEGDACLVEGTIEYKKRKPKWVFRLYLEDTTTGKCNVEVYGGKPGHEGIRIFSADRVTAVR